LSYPRVIYSDIDSFIYRVIEDPAPRMWWCEVEHEDEDDAYKDGNGVVDWGVVCVSGASDVNKTIAFNYRP